MSHLMPTYFNQMQVAFERGAGVWLWDSEGNAYLDAFAGVATCSLGHVHPAITETIIRQASTLVHTSNAFRIPLQEKLAEALGRVSEMDQVYFANAGAEANETALKMTRLHARRRKIDFPTVITMQQSFHGRSFGALSATGALRVQAGFEPLLPGFVHLPLNDVQALEAEVTKNKNVVAVMLEPIQGDGGIHRASVEYMQAVRQLSDEHDLLMVLDEIQCGMGRTGCWFAFQHTDIKPDVMTVAKALGNGIPMGACLSRGKANNLFSPGQHGCTFGGNPLASAVGLSVIETMEKERVLQNCQEIGEHLGKQLLMLQSAYPGIKAIRGQGLMWGIELDRPAMSVVALGAKHRLLFNVVSNCVIRLLPPLVLTRVEADQIVFRLRLVLDDFFTEKKSEKAG